MMQPEIRQQTFAQLAASTGAMRALLEQNRNGAQAGIFSVCSANRLVLEAAFAEAAEQNSLLLIEATCNQVNQEGGYTRLTPEQFRAYVFAIAREQGFPTERLILGGDHLGPNPWRKQPAELAMQKAEAMVAAYVAAGFLKIHLDASMACAGDPAVLPAEVIAGRAAALCAVAEQAAAAARLEPVYVIGTEVPVPGGAEQELEIEVTTTASLKQTIETHRAAFARRNLDAAWERIVGVVVQPGVEFGHETVAAYLPEKAVELSQSVLEWPGIVFEAHSTDYQSAEALRELVRDHFGILKVGPELTFVMREAIFGLAAIEEEWIAAEDRSRLREIVERIMLEQPKDWEPYYRGDAREQRIARGYSLSDRIRYYWPHAEIAAALETLLSNLKQSPAPLTVVAQYLPAQADAIRAGAIGNDPRAMIHDRVRQTLRRYGNACGFGNGRK